jgi:hypothetical protein
MDKLMKYYYNKPCGFVMINGGITENRTMFDKEVKPLDEEAKEEIKEQLTDFLQNQKIFRTFHTLFLEHSDKNFQKIETFLWEDFITSRHIVKLNDSNPYQRAAQMSQLEDMPTEENSKILEKKPTKVAVLRAYKNYNTDRLVLFSKILSGTVQSYSNKKFRITKNFEKFFRFDDIQIGGKRVPKAVAGELVALSFKDRNSYPFFLKKSFVFEESDPNVNGFLRGSSLVDARLELFGLEQKIEVGTKLTIHYCMNCFGVEVMEILKNVDELKMMKVQFFLRNQVMDIESNCREMGSFAVLQGRELIGFGFAEKIYLN